MGTIWHDICGGKANQFSQAISGLKQIGIDLHPFDADQTPGPGLLFFNEITPALCNRINDLSGNGRERLLAVAATPCAITGNIWSLLQAGAADVVAWDGTASCARNIAQRLERWLDVDSILTSPLVQENLVGQSTKWRSMLRQIIEVAHFTDAAVMITGESGTGKELAARLIHSLDQRVNKRDLVVLDCTTVVPTLSGSEFFGHERGAFTGATTSRDGAFALADGGTLFLDEVGELSLELQAQLLRVVQEKTYKRVGGNSWQKTDFRLVSATNRELLAEIGQGRFRNDFYYRIAAWKCRLPSLSERREDIIHLVRHFMQQVAPGGEALEIDRPVEEYLTRRAYPGNVRDLKQLVHRIMYRHVGKGAITVGDIPLDEQPDTDAGPYNWRDEHFESAIRTAINIGVGLKDIGRTAEDTAIRIAVDTEGNNLQRAAKRLGVTDRALQLRRANRRQHGQETEREDP